MSGPRVKLVVPEAKQAKPVIAKLCREMKSKLGCVTGVIVENKGLTASVHYRLIKAKELWGLREKFEEVVQPYLEKGVVRITRGKKFSK